MTTKIKFIGSKITPSEETGVIMLNILYDIENANIMVSLPNNTWSDIRVLLNETEIDFNGEYPAVVNSVIKYAKKQFPNWSV